MPRYADSLLSDGERIALRSRQHWLATVIDGRVPWALFVSAVALIVLRLQLSGDGPAEQLLGFAILGLMVLSLVLLGRLYWAWYAQDYIVTNRRVLKVEGILNKRSGDSSLEKVNDAVLEQNLLGRIFGYGDLDIMTASEDTVDRYRMLDQAPRFKKVMLDEKHRLEVDLARMPGPPARAAGATGSAGATAPRSMGADEVTRALSNLADLRDRGAISESDYEAKKQELLGRL
ncbi:MAG: PH domain-containing protein [Chloroflexi bacterium]|nr:PH domain-containing protein [Chloroflexota bacterium]